MSVRIDGQPYSHPRTARPTTVPAPLRHLGPYQIKATLGQGGAAVVYRAARPNNRPIALKVLHPKAAQTPQLRQMFQNEYKLLARLRHPGIIRTVDAGELDGYFFIALELIEGDNLDAFLRKQEKLGEDPAVEIARQLADALNYLHERGIVHRDIKPSNVMLTPRRRTILFDFGTALDLHDQHGNETDGVYGTPAFLPPEQVQGKMDIDGRADLYSLGILLYRMITGRKPFYGTRDEVLHAQIHETPPLPSEFTYISPDLEALILNAIAKDPAARFQSGEELVQALDKIELVPKPDLTQRLLGWLRG